MLVENLANAETTRTPDGGPYRRKDVVFSENPGRGIFFGQNSIPPSRTPAAGVAVSNRSPSTTAIRERRYLPGHPDADKDGYVAFPNINPAEDMVDLMGASQNYQANVAAISAVKDMIQKSLDLFR